MAIDRFGNKITYPSSSCEELAGKVTPAISKTMWRVIIGMGIILLVVNVTRSIIH